MVNDLRSLHHISASFSREKWRIMSKVKFCGGNIPVALGWIWGLFGVPREQICDTALKWAPIVMIVIDDPRTKVSRWARHQHT